MPKTQDAVLDVEELRNAAATVNAVARLLLELASQKEGKEGSPQPVAPAADSPAEEIPTDEAPTDEASANEAPAAATSDEESPAEPPAERPPAPPLRLEDVRSVLAEKSRAGHTAEVRELLKRHGAERLSEVSADEYPALLAEAEEIGNGD